MYWILLKCLHKKPCFASVFYVKHTFYGLDKHLNSE